MLPRFIHSSSASSTGPVGRWGAPCAAAWSDAENQERYRRSARGPAGLFFCPCRRPTPTSSSRQHGRWSRGRRGPRLENGWGSHGPGVRVLRLPLAAIEHPKVRARPLRARCAGGSVGWSRRKARPPLA